MRSRSLFVIIHCAFSFGEEELLLAADIKVARNMVSPRSFGDALCARVAGRPRVCVVTLHDDVVVGEWWRGGSCLSCDLV